MANTGIKITLTLKEVAAPCPGNCTPTGNTKPNDTEDPDYIPPIVDTISCPVTFTDDCPTIIYSPFSSSIEFEFSLPPSVTNNPALDKINIKVTDAPNTITIGNQLYNFPNTPPNYFHGIIGGLSGSTVYNLVAEYQDSGGAVVKTCPLIPFST